MAAEGKVFGNSEAPLAVARQEPMGKFNIVGYIPQTKPLLNVNHGRGKRTAETSAVQGRRICARFIRKWERDGGSRLAPLKPGRPCSLSDISQWF